MQHVNIPAAKTFFNPGKQTAPAEKDNPYKGSVPNLAYYQQADFPVATSALGTPVYTNIVFKGGRYTNHITGSPTHFDDVELQTVLLGVSQAKKIVKTEIQGRDGTLKEYIGMDDYHITVNAIINGANGHYPAEDVQLLKQMLDAPVTIDVTCDYLLLLGIHCVVVESYSFAQEAGMYSQQKVSINCISDIPIILQPSQA